MGRMKDTASPSTVAVLTHPSRAEHVAAVLAYSLTWARGAVRVAEFGPRPDERVPLRTAPSSCSCPATSSFGATVTPPSPMPSNPSPLKPPQASTPPWPHWSSKAESAAIPSELIGLRHYSACRDPRRRELCGCR